MNLTTKELQFHLAQTWLCLVLILLGVPAVAQAQGSVVGWGNNFSRQATPPAGLSGVVGIAAGGNHSLALKGDGTVVGWGMNSHGEARPPTSLSSVVAISAGYQHSLALKSDGTVVGWGDTSDGKATPPKGLSGVVEIAAGVADSLALKGDGTVIGWGYDGDGEATPPAGLSGVVEIAAGAGHSLALKSDGSVIGWGYDGDGRATPPAGLSGVVGIAAGQDHSLALKSDGTVVGWGYNGYGQATPPAGLNGVVGIAAGREHSLALKSDGTVVGWGWNIDGQATPPAGLSGVVGIAAGDAHSLAVIDTGMTAKLTLNPRTGFAGTPITVTGSGFAPNEMIEVAYRHGSDSMLLGRGTADVNGTAVASARVPPVAYGIYLISATGQSSRRFGQAIFGVAPRMILNPNTGSSGGTTAAQGYGFGAGETVQVYWNSPRLFLGTATADGRGGFPSLTFTIPVGAKLGDNIVFGKGQSSGAMGGGHITIH